MKASRHIRLAASALAVAMAVATLAGAIPSGDTLANAAPLSTAVQTLPGRWSGWGNITMSNGASEQMRCIATYFVQEADDSVRQNLRCASQGYKIDAVANLKVTNGSVSGDWEERTWSTTGSVTGKVLDDGFRLDINGPGFSASMAVGTSKCKQSISITPRGFEISRISMSLGKC